MLFAMPIVHAEEVLHLNDVEVMVAPLSATSQHLSQPITVIDREQLDRRNKTNVSDLVENTPGVTSAGFGPGVGRPVIRGQSGARVGVLGDGLSSMDVSTISPDHAVALDSIFVEQVEILRGPATLLYGSSASGGVVNIVSNNILDYVPESLEGQLYTHLDSATDDKTAGLRLDFGLQDFAFRFDVVAQDYNDISIPGFALSEEDEHDSPGVLENSAQENLDVNFSGSWVNDRGFIGLAVNYLDREYGIPAGTHEHEEEHEEEEGEEVVTISQKQTRIDLKAEVSDPFAGFSKLKTRWALNNHEHLELEGDEIGTRLDNREWQGRVELLHSFATDTNGVIGFQYQNRDLQTSGEEAFIADTELDSFGVFTLQRYEKESWHAELGLRYENQETESQSVEVSHDLFSFSSGVGYHLGNDVNARFTFSHSQRAPAIEEIYSQGAHLATNTFEMGSTSLDKETSNSLDLILSKSKGRFTSEANFYYTWVDDFIFGSESDRNNDGIADRVEADFDGAIANIHDEEEDLLLIEYKQADARFYGIELQGKVLLHESDLQSLSMNLWGDYVRARLSNGGNLPRITPWRVGTGFDYHRQKLSAYLNLTHTGRQSNLAALETAADHYTTLDMGVSYDLQLNGLTNSTIFLRGTNLLDEEIRQQTSFVKDFAPAAGRSAMIGARFEF